MNTEMDFKKLWHKQEADNMPDIKILHKRADNIKRGTRIKLIFENAVLLAISALIIYVGYNIPHALPTTKIGTALMVISMLMYLFVYNRLIPVLFKTNFAISTHEYLEQLISIKRREDFLNRVIVNIYFVLLIIGVGLYFVQFVHNLLGGILMYGLTFSCLLFAWFYIQPITVKRRQKPLMETIAKLEELNRQLENGE